MPVGDLNMPVTFDISAIGRKCFVGVLS